MDYREYAVINPCVLHREDLLELEELMRSDLGGTDKDLTITATAAGHDISSVPFHSFRELLAQEKLPGQVDRLVIDARCSGDGSAIEKNVHLMLTNAISDMRINAQQDSAWGAKVYNDLKGFFKQKRPWYWYFAKSVPPVFNITLGLTMLTLALIFVTKSFDALVFPVVMMLSATIYLTMGLKRVTFPYARISLEARKDDLRGNREANALGWHLVIVIGCILSIVAMIK